MRRYVGILLAVLLSGLIITCPIMASDISTATYSGQINVVNNSYARANCGIPVTINTQNLIDSKFLNSSSSNLALRDGAGADIPFMPAQGSGDQAMIFVDDILQNATNNYYLYMGGDISGGSLAWFPGTGGMTVIDTSFELYLGNSWKIELKGCFYTDNAGTIISKSGVIDVSSLGSPNSHYVEINITGVADFWIWLLDGPHDLIIKEDSTHYYPPRIQVYDGITLIAQQEAGGTIINNTNSWTFAADDTMLYVDYIKIYEDTNTLVGWWYWENGTTFHDHISANDGTPTFRTTASVADITASLISFSPVSPSFGGVIPGSTANIYPITFPEETQVTTPLDQAGMTKLPGGSWVYSQLIAHDIPPGLITYPVMMLLLTVACFLGYWKPKDVWWAEASVLVVSGIFIKLGMLPWAFLPLDLVPFIFVLVKRGGFSRA